MSVRLSDLNENTRIIDDLYGLEKNKNQNSESDCRSVMHIVVINVKKKIKKRQKRVFYPQNKKKRL